MERKYKKEEKIQLENLRDDSIKISFQKRLDHKREVDNIENERYIKTSWWKQFIEAVEEAIEMKTMNMYKKGITKILWFIVDIKEKWKKGKCFEDIDSQKGQNLTKNIITETDQTAERQITGKGSEDGFLWTPKPNMVFH